MKYEEPNMEIILIYDDIITTSTEDIPGLVPDEGTTDTGGMGDL